jgi:protein tyrosine kinase modulator
VLQTLGSDESRGFGEPAFGEDHVQSPSLGDYINILKRRFFYFLVPFAAVSILGLFLIANFQKPVYLSEGKILVESQVIAPDLVGPLVAATSGERIQRIQQRVMTRGNLLSIANKFGLFPGRPGVLDLMRESSEIKPAEIAGQPRLQNAPAIAFTIGFEYENPELAMRVASEFVSLIVNEDARSRTSRSTEVVKILTSETKDIEDKLEVTKTQISEIARRPREEVPEAPEQQLAALAALRAELIQKTSVYSNAHPAVIALKKRVAEMEKATQQAPVKAKSTQVDDIEALKRQRDALEKRLDEANGKLATARLNEKLDRDQQSERLQIIESPSLPQRPLKSNRLKFVGMAFAAAAALGIGTLIAAELSDGSIHGRHQLLGVVPSPLIVSIPYITTRADVIRARWKVIFGAVSVVVLLVVLGGLATAIVLHLPVDGSWLERAGIGFRVAGQ